MDIEGVNVDAQTKLDIMQLFKEGMKEFSEDIKEHIDLKVSPIEGDVLRLKGSVDDLYDKDRENKQAIGDLNARISAHCGETDGQAKAADAARGTSGNIWTAVASIIAALALIYAIYTGTNQPVKDEHPYYQEVIKDEDTTR